METISHIAESFLPRGASLITIGDTNNPSILKEDMDDDGHEEMLILYERGRKYYLMGLKETNTQWQRVFNRETRYMSIKHYSLIKLEKGSTWQIVLSGALKHRSKNQMMLLEWRFDYLISLLDHYVEYDALRIGEELENESVTQLTIGIQQNDQFEWTHYRYEERKLLEVKEEIEEIKVKEEVKEEVNEYLIGMTGYLHKEGVEEEIYLVGKQEGNSIRDMKLVVTTEGQSKQHVLLISEPVIWQYGLLVGHFLGNKTEEILLKVNEAVDGKEARIWLLEVGGRGIRSYFEDELYLKQTCVMYEDYYRLKIQVEHKTFIIDLSHYPLQYLEKWYTKEGVLKCPNEGYIKLNPHLYPTDSLLNETFGLCMEYDVMDSDIKERLAKIVKTFEGENGKLMMTGLGCMIPGKSDL